MQKFLGFFLGLFLLIGPAQADTFVWKDPAEDFTLSFPDSWTLQTEDSSTTKLRIAGPIATDLATCRMQVEEDGRAKIYPKRLVDEAVVGLLDEDFWRGQIAVLDNAELGSYYAPAGLGDKGDATAIRFSFLQDKTPMHGVAIASIYGGKRYIATCSSRQDSYEQYADLFGSILGSTELKSKYHPFAIGYYRDFLADPKLVLPRVKPGTLHKNTFYLRENKYNQ